MTESFAKNFIDYEEYPQSADIQNRCVSMIGRLFNAPTNDDEAAAVGTSVSALPGPFLARRRRGRTALAIHIVPFTP